MIYDASTWSTPQTLQADLCVVGAGAGGAMAAMVAAQSGLRVVLLEAGPF
ncbi:MAG: choline dehydrogenase-like flavoprotein, partial [Flavobacteriales bacterium]